ncbi:YaeQ family protein [Azonexus sp. IMCC34839]|uniref:YaeQ family protein n=1 Tax=Azonexus sp. IMCC34839 TaxID=3133695 RepID=UPI00399B091B
MALKSTIYKAEIQVADLDRGHFGDYSLTLARHPSETDERMMVRLLAFALNAGPDLSFGKGLSTDDEPALWEIDPSGVIRLWIEVGIPDENRIRKGCNKSDRVLVLAYGARAVDVWWEQNAQSLRRYGNLEVWRLTAEDAAILGGLAEKSMKMAFTHQEGMVYIDSFVIKPERLFP